MPTFVRTEKCAGCQDEAKAACMNICPHDLMALDRCGAVAQGLSAINT